MSNDVCLVGMDVLSSDTPTCNAELNFELPDFPTEENPFKFFDLNLSSEDLHIFSSLHWQSQWKSKQSIKFKNFDYQNITKIIIKLFNSVDDNNQFYSETAANIITKIAYDIWIQFTDQCDIPAKTIAWKLDLQTPKIYYNDRPELYNQWTYCGLPFWHLDYTDAHAYRVTIAFTSKSTPFYAGEMEYYDMSEVFDSGGILDQPKAEHLGMEGEGIVTAQKGQGAFLVL